MKICDNVASISVGHDCGWIVRLDGGLVCYKVLEGAARYAGLLAPAEGFGRGLCLPFGQKKDIFMSCLDQILVIFGDQ